MSVGKRSGRHSRDQTSINDLMFFAARQGKRVVRLKGGDPSIFGRSAEEIAHLSRAGITVRVCPGITAASAASASAGVSLTLRGFLKADAPERSASTIAERTGSWLVVVRER